MSTLFVRLFYDKLFSLFIKEIFLKLNLRSKVFLRCTIVLNVSIFKFLTFCSFLQFLPMYFCGAGDSVYMLFHKFLLCELNSIEHSLYIYIYIYIYILCFSINLSFYLDYLVIHFSSYIYIYIYKAK